MSLSPCTCMLMISLSTLFNREAAKQPEGIMTDDVPADEPSSTLFIDAAAAGDLDAVRRLCGTAELRLRDESGWSALTWASAEGHTPVVEFLIQQGAIDAEVEQAGCVSDVAEDANPPSLVGQSLARNAFGNTAAQVTKHAGCKSLLSKAVEAAADDRRFLCSSSGLFVGSRESCAVTVVDRVSAPSQRPVRYSTECASKIRAAEAALEAATAAMDKPEALQSALDAANASGASVHLIDAGTAALLRLEAQLALEEQVITVNRLRPLESRSPLKPLSSCLKLCRERESLPSLIEQGEQVLRSVDAELALQECTHASSSLRLTDAHVTDGDEGDELILPSHTFAVVADAGIASLEGLIAAARAAGALDEVLRAGDSALSMLMAESELRHALDEPRLEEAEAEAAGGETSWLHPDGQKSTSPLERLELQCGALAAALEKSEVLGTAETVLEAARAKQASLQELLKQEVAAEETRVAKAAAAAAKKAKKK
ncbi:hypothetical protein EMIHUDRAFT_221628 [Emiliania huxleyi CCMP1516]|uniref:Uncharacterized protein n=2 Tax=Emiliania huxleyi TaxID=2903 RepID=A0A0D3HXX5_EMIH1|nr:hypothetical protein EMIHUDRAFT_221628 [Emiliania huxleyi CCMP1516]EOD03860.1 hypothetical protein EMIHUDRAFT_221628 [Emiliania huxleyi CCMP1516]|eukprot:XP_005756289.1 hypothetical protein EMIHUDRAFT_221628 [Emiliania huxleyi CCMP1516]